jgi:hypothetical protein
LNNNAFYLFKKKQTFEITIKLENEQLVRKQTSEGVDKHKRQSQSLQEHQVFIQSMAMRSKIDQVCLFSICLKTCESCSTFPYQYLLQKRRLSLSILAKDPNVE